MLSSPEWVLAVRRAVGVASAAGIALTVAGGCADPVCGTSSIDELRIHGGSSVERLTNGEVGSAIDELATATGISVHPTPTRYLTAGVMIAPAPIVTPGGTP
jgi:hypothetical protein